MSVYKHLVIKLVGSLILLLIYIDRKYELWNVIYEVILDYAKFFLVSTTILYNILQK